MKENRYNENYKGKEGGGVKERRKEGKGKEGGREGREKREGGKVREREVREEKKEKGKKPKVCGEDHGHRYPKVWVTSLTCL